MFKLIENVKTNATESIISVFKDQYLECYTCDSLGPDILMRRATHRNNSSNNKASEDVISAGSKVLVPEGMAAILVDNGKATEAVTKEGAYIWEDSSSSSVMWGGKFNKMIGDSFDRFRFGGEIPTQQRIYCVNMLEIRDNSFKSDFEFPYKDAEYRNVYLKIDQTFSFRICDPMLFYKTIAGAVKGDFKTSSLTGDSKNPGQLVLEAQDVAIEVVNLLSQKNISFAELMSKRTFIVENIKKRINTRWQEKRGIELVSFTMNINPGSSTVERVASFDNAKLYAEDTNALASRTVLDTNEAMKQAAGNAPGNKV